MHPDQTKQILDHAKGLFRFMTVDQGKRLRDIVADFPDFAFVWAVLDDLATQKPTGAEDWQEGNLSIVSVSERLKAELRRRGMTTEDVNRRKQRETEAKVYASWQKIDEMIAELSDQDLEDLKPSALMYLTNQKARDMLGERSVRESKTLRWLVYRLLTERSAA